LDKFRLVPNGISGTLPDVYFALRKPYEADSFNLSQGKRLYSWFGRASCHGDGRGDKGPVATLCRRDVAESSSPT
jgi:cytochrome c oxidase cbb3-type subunit 3